MTHSQSRLLCLPQKTGSSLKDLFKKLQLLVAGLIDCKDWYVHREMVRVTLAPQLYPRREAMVAYLQWGDHMWLRQYTGVCNRV